MSDDKTIRIEKARSVLKASDQAIVRALETEVMGAEWCAWRERVREIARNGGEDVPPEPPRTKRLFDPHAEPAAVVMPEFLKDAEPPTEFADLVRTGETYEQTNARLLPPYREAQHMKERAIEDGNKADRVFWETKIRKIDLAMNWMHGRLIETI